VRIGFVVMGGVDPSGRDRVIPVLMSLIECLAKRHELHVFVLNQQAEPTTYPLLGATVHDLGRVSAFRGFRRRAQLARFFPAVEKIGGFDLLHAYWALPAGFVATAAARRLRVPTVITASSGEWVSIPDVQYGLQRRWVDRRAVAIAMKRASRVTVCTHYMAALATRHGVTTEFVPVGVPRPTVSTTERPPGPPWRVVHVASINRVKDHATLLRAFAAVTARVPDVHLDIIGADTMDGAMHRLASGLGLQGQVAFHGFLRTDEIAPFYARAHVHVLSSRHEGASVATLEAAAAGVPTVGTNVGYVADWAAEGGRALAVPVGDPEALAAGVVAVLKSPDLRASLAAAAQRWALAHDTDWTVERFGEIYRSLVAAR
jgi:glycosyltransferase involved in cell wall biosynthesis